MALGNQSIRPVLPVAAGGKPRRVCTESGRTAAFRARTRTVAQQEEEEGYRNDRRRRLLSTTNTDENAMAAPAIIGFSRPSAASGMAATL